MSVVKYNLKSYKMVQINLKNLSKIREKYKGEKIVFCSGSFDLLHPCHIIFLENCKKLGDILVVAVGKDLAIKKLKNSSRPILNEKMRLKMIDSLKIVDYSLLNKASKKNPFSDIEIIFKKLRPNIYTIKWDTFDIPRRKELCKKYNIKMAVLADIYYPKEYENITTTKIIEKIKNL